MLETYIAVYNFLSPFPILPNAPDGPTENIFLSFYIGERLRIDARSDNWCFGHLLSDPSIHGMFPFTHVTLLEDIVDTETPRVSGIYGEEEAKRLLSEITETLKAWWQFIKSLYAKGMDERQFLDQVALIKELMIIRKRVLSGSVPTQELRELRQFVAAKIDEGNHKLHLGMHIRDSTSHVLRVDNLSVIAAYREHERAFEAITGKRGKTPQQTGRKTLLLSILPSEFPLNYNCELTLILWHAGQSKALTEPLTYTWSRQTNQFEHTSLTGMFLGLTDEEFSDEKFELVAALTIVTPIDLALNAMSSKPNLKADQLGNAVFCRQPLAEARLPLSEKLRDLVDKERRELRLSLVPLTPLECFQPPSFGRKRESHGMFIDVTLQLLHGASDEEIGLKHPEIFATNPPMAIRRIQPNDITAIISEVRNEVYLCLGAADLHGGRYTDKNVEVILRVFDDEGTPQNGRFETISPVGIHHHDTHRSRVFLADDKPNFNELVKIALPDTVTRDLHVRFLFFHRRTADKSYKGPFAMAYLPLFSNGVLQKSTNDELQVYKVEKYEERNVSYLRLAFCKQDAKNSVKHSSRQESSSFILNDKNFLSVDTTVLSCVHTTHSELLQMLKFREKQTNCIITLNGLIANDSAADEIVKFLPEFCDSLFQILSTNVDNKSARDVVFSALVFVIRITDDMSLRFLLDNYLAYFHAVDAHHPLFVALCDAIDTASTKLDGTKDPLKPILTALGYLMQIALKSNSNFEVVRQHYPMNLSPETTSTLEDDIMLLLEKLKNLVQDNNARLVSQNTAIQHLPDIIQPLVEAAVIDPFVLSQYIVDVLQEISKNVLIPKKVLFINSIVSTDLFLIPNCMDLLFPIFIDDLVALLETNLPACTVVPASGFLNCSPVIDAVIVALSNIIEKLFPFCQLKAVYQTGKPEHLNNILFKATQPVIRMVGALLDKDPILFRPVYAVFLALLDKFSAPNFLAFLARHSQRQSRWDVLTELLNVFRSILRMNPFPEEWYQMSYVQNKLIAKHLRFVKAYIASFATLPDDLYLWVKFMQAASTFVQKVSLASLVPGITVGYENDVSRMRQAVGQCVRSLWSSGAPWQKSALLTDVLQEVLIIALVGDTQMRSDMMDVFYDMMLIESEPGERRFIDNFILRLDPFVDKGLGDATFQKQLRLRYSELCSANDIVQLEFVERVERLLGLLLNDRQVRHATDCVDSAKYCLVQLVNFYAAIDLNELKVHHLNNLYEAHLNSGSDVEAAFTLKRFTQLLDWSSTPVPPYIMQKHSHRTSGVSATQAKLREALYIEMATLFDRGEHWERAIDVLKELIPVYENISVDYGKLADLYRQIGCIYDKINSRERNLCYYFLVAFYGKGYPEYLANKKFIFRGRPLEMLSDFKERMLTEYFGAQFIDNVDDNSQLADTNGRFIQIIPVLPVLSKRRSRKSCQSCLISWYYKHHDIYEFEHVRSERRENTKWTAVDSNDATKLWLSRRVITTAHPLPDILNFAAVEREDGPEIWNPVDVALRKIEEVNENLRETAELVEAGFTNYFKSLGGWIRGVLQADVGGGIKNYDSFFLEETKTSATPAELCSIERLQQLLLKHVGILEYCLCVHASKQHLVSETLHTALVDLFGDYRRNIESRFANKAPSYLRPGESICLPSSGQLKASGSAANVTATSSSSLTLDDSGTSSSVLLRAVPGAATLLRSRNRFVVPKKTTATPTENNDESSVQRLQTLRSIACQSVILQSEGDSELYVDAYYRTDSNSLLPSENTDDYD